VTAIPDEFAGTVRRVWGAAGERWLAGLPELVAEIAARWSLTVGPLFPLSFHWVAAVTRADGSRAVLRLGVPGQPEDASAVLALRLLGGDGAVALLADDPAAGAMLLERADPGTPLAELAESDDPAATAVLLNVMHRLHRPAPTDLGLPTVAGWGRGFDRLRSRHGGGTGPLPAPLVTHAERIWAELAAPPPAGSPAGSLANTPAGTTASAPASSPVLLHGDLHHDNVLRSDRAGWLAIDPKGVLGEPLHEVGPLLLNPWPGLLRWPDPGAVLGRRVEQLADGLGLPARTVRRWGFAFAVLSAVWSDEDGAPRDDHSLTVAELLG
jgi:streptomycin 6-kinase